MGLFQVKTIVVVGGGGGGGGGGFGGGGGGIVVVVVVVVVVVAIVVWTSPPHKRLTLNAHACPNCSLNPNRAPMRVLNVDLCASCCDWS